MKLKMIALGFLIATVSVSCIQAAATLIIKNESGQKANKVTIWTLDNGQDILAKCSENNFPIENGQSKTITCDSYMELGAINGGITTENYLVASWYKSLKKYSANRTFTIKKWHKPDGTAHGIE
jgi:hypothetical protein